VFPSFNLLFSFSPTCIFLARFFGLHFPSFFFLTSFIYYFCFTLSYFHSLLLILIFIYFIRSSFSFTFSFFFLYLVPCLYLLISSLSVSFDAVLLSFFSLLFCHSLCFFFILSLSIFLSVSRSPNWFYFPFSYLYISLLYV
jgi:hypothetical protein